MQTPPTNPPQNTLTEDNALFVAKATVEKGIATVKIERGKKLIEQLMSPQDLKDTGVGRLLPAELANLNRWLDPDRVLAPGDPPQGPH
jgi:hypothetical protein